MKKCLITVSPDMTEATFAYLCEKARTKFGSETFFMRKDDPALIGGFILETDGGVYDMSVRTQLDRIRASLKEEPRDD